jgi:hypothetical protein
LEKRDFAEAIIQYEECVQVCKYFQENGYYSEEK